MTDQMYDFSDVAARTIMGALDIELIEASGDRVVLRMPVAPTVHQPYGLLHGGASVVLAETGASIGAWLGAGPEFQAFGVEINANHLSSVRTGHVTSVSTPVRQGRTMAVWDTRITHDETEKLVCVSRCTLVIKAAGTHAPPSPDAEG